MDWAVYLEIDSGFTDVSTITIFKGSILIGINVDFSDEAYLVCF